MKTMLGISLVAAVFAGAVYAGSGERVSWNSRSAAAYLDQRASWWVTWKQAARDHDSFCISCHTALPYALARPSLRTALGEEGPSPTERQFVENVTKRVRLWDEVQPNYTDEKSGAPKSAESRATEAIINALVLVTYDAGKAKLSDDTRKALDNMWALQLKAGENRGAWSWLNFHNEPWEADDSQYWGTTLAAIAVGTAPKEYRSEVRENMKLLGEYLRRGAKGQSTLNRTVLLWAAGKLPGLLSAAQKNAILEEIYAKQQEDGGWSASSLVVSTWKRKDGTAMEAKSDGYATGLVTLALEQTGVRQSQAQLKRAIAWLEQNQDKTTGGWVATSLNKKRDPASDAGRFMSDAATAYSVLALSEVK